MAQFCDLSRLSTPAWRSHQKGQIFPQPSRTTACLSPIASQPSWRSSKLPIDQLHFLLSWPIIRPPASPSLTAPRCHTHSCSASPHRPQDASLANFPAFDIRLRLPLLLTNSPAVWLIQEHCTRLCREATYRFQPIPRLSSSIDVESLTFRNCLFFHITSQPDMAHIGAASRTSSDTRI